MTTFWQKIAPICTLFLALLIIDGGVNVDYADARSRLGGRMFSRPAPRKAPVTQNMKQAPRTNQNKSGFGRGLAGGLLGGALGAMLFGSLFGASGQGMGFLPILLLAGVGYFLYRRFAAKAAGAGAAASGPSSQANIFGMGGGSQYQQYDNEDQVNYLTPVELGIQEIQQSDPGFDRNYFVEIASDVFFQVQAGWMRREIDSYKHLLGDLLVQEYTAHFAEMKEAGHINKLESIAIRKVEIVNAGSEKGEDFITVLFTANLLDYIIDETTEEVISGSNTQPVKFAEEWTWARQTGTENWLMEGIKVVSE